MFLMIRLTVVTIYLLKYLGIQFFTVSMLTYSILKIFTSNKIVRSILLHLMTNMTVVIIHVRFQLIIIGLAQ